MEKNEINQMNLTFNRILADICKELNIKYQIISDDYLTILQYQNKFRYLNGTLFGLNSEISGLICKDKSAMYEILKQFKVPVISYKLIWHEGNKNFEIDSKIKEITKYFYENNRHIVIKDNLGSGGFNVYEIKEDKEIAKIFKTLLKNTRSIVLNPFYNIKKEYRLIFLNNECRLIFSKEAKDGEWQHNLAKGSITSKDIDLDLKEKLIKLGELVNKTLQTKFVSIDLIQDISNNLYVLEVNTHVTLEKYLNQHREDYLLIKNIYKDAIGELFKE